MPWRDIWSAVQSVGLIDSIEPVADLVARLTRDFDALPAVPDWRGRLSRLTHGWG